METTLIKLLGLAMVDAINPCALAVMVIVLMNLLFHDKANKKKALYGGLAFSLAVFLLYFIYGLVLTFIFKGALPNTGTYANYAFKGFGVLAIILGILNIKDYFFYKPGGLVTEMPLSMRPKMRVWIKKIRTPKGAFIIGILVTLFLLPCTIGPLVVAAGILSKLTLTDILIKLLIYDLVFIAPMIIITLGIYFGVTTIENVGGWKERNIKLIHLVEGLILTTLGILMFTGII
ncbi:hypothetical protein GOV14_04290 [Candidatus Pacearchaeota archaeon]|nr:hypothetical protein [Candidatus Pacearchaeota archaeon]